jgi:hypothetical protein
MILLVNDMILAQNKDCARLFDLLPLGKVEKIGSNDFRNRNFTLLGFDTLVKRSDVHLSVGPV